MIFSLDRILNMMLANFVKTYIAKNIQTTLKSASILSKCFCDSANNSLLMRISLDEDKLASVSPIDKVTDKKIEFKVIGR